MASTPSSGSREEPSDPLTGRTEEGQEETSNSKSFCWGEERNDEEVEKDNDDDDDGLGGGFSSCIEGMRVDCISSLSSSLIHDDDAGVDDVVSVKVTQGTVNEFSNDFSVRRGFWRHSSFSFS